MEGSSSTPQPVDASLIYNGNPAAVWLPVAAETNRQAYPRPQGNLPMFEYGLTRTAQQALTALYSAVAPQSRVSP